MRSHRYLLSVATNPNHSLTKGSPSGDEQMIGAHLSLQELKGAFDPALPKVFRQY